MSVEFFRFVRGAETWRYCTANETISAASFEWLPEPIRRSPIDVSTEIDKSTVSISARRGFEAVAPYVYTTPRDVTYVTIYRADLADIAGTFGALWHGQVSNVAWQGSTLEIRCSPVLALLRRASPRQRYSVGCRWALYDTGCGVNPNNAANFRTGEIVDTDGPQRVKLATFEVANDAENWARSGTLTVTSMPHVAVETVTYSEATVIVGAVRHRWVELMRPLEDFGLGELVRLQRGCGHTFADCTAFGNTARYGGFHLMPTRLTQ